MSDTHCNDNKVETESPHRRAASEVPLLLRRGVYRPSGPIDLNDRNWQNAVRMAFWAFDETAVLGSKPTAE